MSFTIIKFYSTINANTFIESSLEIVISPADNSTVKIPFASNVYLFPFIFICLLAPSEMIVSFDPAVAVKLTIVLLSIFNALVYLTPLYSLVVV